MNSKDYIKLWSNDKKRREFIADYHNTAIEVIIEPTLELAFYVTKLPNEHKIIVMEHWAKNYDYRTKDDTKKVIHTKYFYQDEDFFEPTVVSDSFISNRLKDLKAELQKEMN